jgi:DNA-binding transcriptional LysR family regulator
MYIFFGSNFGVPIRCRQAFRAGSTQCESPKTMSISLAALRYFNAVAETGSISAAVQNLNVSQATITESIQRLESHLGTLLFQRHARGMSMTHAGHEFLRHAQRILGAVSAAESALASRPDALAGDLVVGAVSPLTGYYLPTLLERYRRTYPRVRTQVYEDAGHFIEHQLINGELDLGLMIVSALETSTFHTRVLVRSPWRLWVSANHRLSDRQQVSIVELRQQSIIALRNEELESAASDLWRRAGFRPRVTVRTRSVEATRSLVATGYGICILPEVLFRAWSLDGERLLAIPLIEDIPPLEVGVAWRRGAPVSAQADAFLTTAREHAPAH